MTRDATVIFVSALDNTDDKVDGLALGAVDYISKPFQPKEVLARVDAHLTIHCLRRELAERNRELSAANQHILEAVAEGIYGLDAEGRISFANPAACAITGFDEQELLGRSAHDLHLHARWDGSAYPRNDSPITATLARGETVHSDDEVFWRQQGDHIPVSLTSAPIRDGNRITGAVLAFQDIRERKRQEQALHRALTEVESLKEKLAAENAYLRDEVRSEGNFGNIVGESSVLRAVLEQVRQVAPTRSTVLIQGESGTGKEAIARAIHDLSPRRERPLIKVNCGAISPNLIESELFGHEKGSFTGALRQRTGYFELADRGTIFLDEVAELPAEAQIKLLRVLQEQEFTRVGGDESIQVDVRVIAATNKHLPERVESGSFRLDLFYRLNVFPLTVPPLRERREDIPQLVSKFLSDQARSLGKPLEGVSEASMRRLLAYSWPGNIRELENLMERCAILAQNSVVEIDPALLESGIRVSGEAAKPAVADGPSHDEMLTLADNEARHILRVLQHTGGTIAGKGGAAEILGLPASTLRSRMKKLGIDRP